MVINTRKSRINPKKKVTFHMIVKDDGKFLECDKKDIKSIHSAYD